VNQVPDQEKNMNLDLRTVYITSSLLNITLSLYLFFVWFNHRKNYRGIALFASSVLLISVGFTGRLLQEKLPTSITIVGFNPLIAIGLILMYIALRQFFNRKTGAAHILAIATIPAVLIIEQIMFGLIYPDPNVRIVSYSMAFIFGLLLSTVFLVRLRLYRSFPGFLMILNFSVQIIALGIRILFTILHPLTGLIPDTTGIHAAVFLTFIVISSIWPFGFSLLISDRLKEKEELQNRDKTVLIRELYHRTKNNMQMVCSFLSLQRVYSKSEAAKAELLTADNRIRTMALVHEKLYKSPDMLNISLREYITELLQLISNNFPPGSHTIENELHIDDIRVLTDTAIPMGLVTNELVTNSIKHAFVDGKGKISITITKKPPHRISFLYRDNGKGLPEGFDCFDAETLGLQTITNIVMKQMSGDISFESKDGFRCRMEFDDKQNNERI
jgi:two-component sensor histidine kinase